MSFPKQSILALTLNIEFERLEELSASVLWHCDSMSDVQTILETHRINDHQNMNRNFYLALETKQKSFVAHHYYQHCLREKEGFQNNFFRYLKNIHKILKETNRNYFLNLCKEPWRRF